MHLQAQGFAKPLVHIIDREGDAVGHILRWQGGASYWLVRAKDNTKMLYAGKSMDCKQVAEGLIYSKTCQLSYLGKLCYQWIADTDVVLARAAKPSQKKGKKPVVPGPPVPAGLVVSRIVSEEGKMVAEWLLLANVKDVDAATIALWRYWRWSIESVFKLVGLFVHA